MSTPDFRKFSYDTDVASCTLVKQSIARGYRSKALESFPALQLWAESFWPKKVPVSVARTNTKAEIVLVDGVALFVQAKKGPIIPTLRFYHQYPVGLARVRVDKGAIRFVLGGANIMAPGITHEAGALPTDADEVSRQKGLALLKEAIASGEFEASEEEASESEGDEGGAEEGESNAALLPAGTLVAVYAEGCADALAIGKLLMDSDEIVRVNKGHAIELIHVVYDGLWRVDEWAGGK
jgi:PUA domain protein